MKQAPVFDEIYKQYLADVSAIDLNIVGNLLGINVDGDEAAIKGHEKRAFFLLG